MKPFRIILCDMNKTVTELWTDFIQKTATKNPNLVYIYSGSFDSLIQKLKQDNVNKTKRLYSVVSPGNSFGYLGGGFDLALYNYFGGAPFEKWFRKQLNNEYKPVGSITIVDLNKCENKSLNPTRDGMNYIVHCPTMITPNGPIFNPSEPMKTGVEPVFDATWNSLRYAPENTDAMIISGLCTGYAAVPESLSCKSMIFAIRLYLCDGLLSSECKNVLIMHFLGSPYKAYFPKECEKECERVGIDMEKLRTFNALTDSIDSILPPHLIIE
ncbi:similar to Saccharomyces cerevisiae YMR087W Putative ADP-ribose-1''-monophosphatase that converts ADP-ribose-1''-monophosphate to ADP-ribose [Maudiozyma barnettii]|uniref:Similar to Saccharomyces cerevisiae YMR087W Putative ADP-ribose-1''-monophosphatase that converts ADP-ribose-1''-monophosphate to ADP-ribose n=1 Tax=Maudiozyma barnettii TaxID=61262 RepID=A0A8H2VDE9_9SACH|nr:similar to Saccharomyces cerevisiae YMR087W Putative ADP-ribose-1''-monophosphatase that converts ADP-ribose-1''-monophosphate to ADP-ribose [Kazachstania barnettii]CAB4253281.1 similar to Saccharomyces cerevisiae YMR087W Putative ADP-ribose-1''-monophosphatase that converts ADP-ribose-1''-monophosphate to ADP-ribose [Kazachstania barnettii]CAD1780183.1 similar to Saccharomyces cerevisiae YMR087W Putative ADP-ribose-1''-monophosphatase that converts ADP-ribose-1''-monophosphate to ADP-ribose [